MWLVFLNFWLTSIIHWSFCRLMKHWTCLGSQSVGPKLCFKAWYQKQSALVGTVDLIVNWKFYCVILTKIISLNRHGLIDIFRSLAWGAQPWVIWVDLDLVNNTLIIYNLLWLFLFWNISLKSYIVFSYFLFLFHKSHSWNLLPFDCKI